MTMNKFDQIIASKLNASNYASDESVWKNIEKALPTANASADPQAVPFYAGIAASALILLSLIALPTLSEQKINSAKVAQQNESILINSISSSSSPAQIENAELILHKPQENHEIELVLIDSKSPLVETSKKPSPVREKEVGNIPNLDVNQRIAKEEIESKGAETGILSNYDFKAIGIQCVDKSVQFECNEKLKNIRWIIDGVHVLEGHMCEFVFEEEGAHEVVMMVDQNGKTFSVRKSIEIFDAPSPIINYEVIRTPRCFEQSVELISTPGTNTYNWSYNQNKLSGNSVVFSMPEGRNNVMLTAISPEGCVAQIMQDIVVDGGLKVFIPNSFTPDNDGQNDTWFAKGLDKCASFNVQVFRATDLSLVYETSELKPWDGSFQGSTELAQRGDQFVYTITMTDDCGINTKERGSLNSL